MQGIEGAYEYRHGKGIQSTRQYRWSKLQQRDSSDESKGRLTVGIGESAGV